jgi:cell shape-determining protein MreD
MRWFIFLVFAFVLLVLETGLRSLLRVDTSAGQVCPSFLLILATFVAVWAPARIVPWAMLVLGLLCDLQPIPVVEPVTVASIIGPATLGYMLGGFAVLQVRSLIYRNSPFALAITVIVAGVFVHLVIIAALTVRGVPLPGFPGRLEGWSVADQFYRRFFELLYTAALAVPLGWLLGKTQPIWGFESVKSPWRR